MVESTKDAPRARPRAGRGRLSLANIDGLSPAFVERIACAGIGDAGQLISMAASPVTRPALVERLGLLADGDLTRLVRRVKSALPPGVGSFFDKFLLDLPATGAILPPASITLAASGLTLPASAASTSASQINLIGGMPAVRDQFQGNTCVAFALTALNEYAWRAQGQDADFSERALYAETKPTDGTGDPCGGTYLAAAARVLAAPGQVLDSACPLTDSPQESACYYAQATGLGPGVARYPLQTRMLPTASADPNAPGLQIGPVKAALASGSPVAVAVRISSVDTMTYANMHRGIIPVPSIGPADEGHAVCLVGFLDDPSGSGDGSFIVRNSWGMFQSSDGGSGYWGEASAFGRGYGTLSYGFLQTFGVEAYALANPVVSPPPPPPPPSPGPEPTGPPSPGTITLPPGFLFPTSAHLASGNPPSAMIVTPGGNRIFLF